MLSAHPNSRICPVEQPYSDNKTCTNCTRQSFDYTLLKCVPM